MIEIDDAAKSKIREMYARNPGKYLRIILDGDGCAGPYFGLSLDEAGCNEETARVNGVDILVSESVRKYADVTTINIFVNPDGADGGI